MRSLFSLTLHCSTRSSSLVTLNTPFVNSGLKISNRSFYYLALILWNSRPSHLSHPAHHSSSSPAFNPSVSLILSTSILQKNVNFIYFVFPFFCNMYSLTGLISDRFLWYRPCLGTSTVLSFLINTSLLHSSTHFLSVNLFNSHECLRVSCH